MTMRTTLGNLRLLGSTTEDKPKAGRKRASGDDPVQPTAGENRLDMRGLMVDECLLELDRFIDQALRTGLREFTIVHGKGTGALRSAVQKYLKDSKFVKTHRLGVYGEGESGVTIVELK